LPRGEIGPDPGAICRRGEIGPDPGAICRRGEMGLDPGTDRAAKPKSRETGSVEQLG
jgi:hypothetical protein